jgi:transposase InsO family protein
MSATDFFTVEVLTPRGLITYYVLFIIHLEGRRVTLAGVTEHPNDRWMQQIERNITMEAWGCLNGSRYLLHDGDTKFTEAFREILRASGVEPLRLPPASPHLNAYAERWVRSIKSECLSKLILFGEASLRRSLREYLDHYHTEPNHQGKGNVLLFPDLSIPQNVDQKVHCRERPGGLLKYYEAA